MDGLTPLDLFRGGFTHAKQLQTYILAENVDNNYGSRR